MLRHLPVAALIWAAVSCTTETGQETAQSLEEDLSVTTSGNHQVHLTTELGEIVIELDPGKAPVSVANFLSYVDSGHYDSTIFHRAIDGYLVEAGRIHLEGTSAVEKLPQAPIENESRNGLQNDRGTVAMARNARPDSATAAFFINLADNRSLNFPQPDGHGYAVFGKVVSGMEIADQIGMAETGIRPLSLYHPATGELEIQRVADVPLEAVTILSARRSSK
ncbi:peptidylprolyl isomerase [Haloferula chungangensis]|uniref:Peptidyl-prolyl cis-trans isomerase n=1 Tax=Haloferula chungangensis TaxID=1048331 RepID=A0ABW2L1U3_9BACT